MRLRDGVVPSIFEAFPSHLQKKTSKRKPPKSRPLCDPAPQEAQDSGHSTLAVPENPVQTNSGESPTKAQLKRKLGETETQLVKSRKKIKLLHQKTRRLKKKNAELCSVISALKQKNLVSENSLTVLESCAGGVSDLVKRQVAKNSGEPLLAQYSPTLKSFALTLHFYSPNAYRFVRKTFDTCLPHPRTLRKWYNTVEVKPGFTNVAFSALKQQIQSSPDNHSVFSLIMDEMAIRQEVEWDGNKYHGFIDMGTELDDDCLPVAKEALTLMVVSHKSAFKVPVGYFLINGLGGIERSNLVLQALSELHSVGVNIVSLTCDGSAPNLSMLTHLGCSLQPHNIKSHFSHPSTGKPVCALLDPCHMFKLVRNSLGNLGTFLDGKGNTIEWEFIKRLHKLQEKEGLHLGNKLRAAHIDFLKKPMNVKLAVQLLSESVADSLQFCLDQKIPGFQGCQGTINFIRAFNALFDIMNSRNLCSYGWKRPLQADNNSEVMQFLTEIQEYLLALTLPRDNLPVVRSRRKTGFIGFLVCCKSIEKINEMLLTSPKPVLE